MLKISKGKYSRMTDLCSACGEPRNSRGKLGLCAKCNARRMSFAYRDADFPRDHKRKGSPKLNLPMNILPLEIAGYIAGIIDADGTVSGINVSIVSKDRNFLETIQQLMGGKVSSQGKKMYQLSLRKLEQLYILPQIIPFMIYKKTRL